MLWKVHNSGMIQFSKMKNLELTYILNALFWNVVDDFLTSQQTVSSN